MHRGSRFELNVLYITEEGPYSYQPTKGWREDNITPWTSKLLKPRAYLSFLNLYSVTKQNIKRGIKRIRVISEIPSINLNLASSISDSLSLLVVFKSEPGRRERKRNGKLSIAHVFLEE